VASDGSTWRGLPSQDPDRVGMLVGAIPLELRVDAPVISPSRGRSWARFARDHEEILAAAQRLMATLHGAAEELFAFPELKDSFMPGAVSWSDHRRGDRIIARDAEETVDAAIDFPGLLRTFVGEQPRPDFVIHHSYSSSTRRSMRLTSSPTGSSRPSCPRMPP